MKRFLTTSSEPVQPWRVDMVCCGRGMGSLAAPTWEEADDFRERWLANLPTVASLHGDEGPHDRSAIIRFSWDPVGGPRV